MTSTTQFPSDVGDDIIGAPILVFDALRGAKRRVIFDDPEANFEGGMEFRLTYEGPLYATQRDARNGQTPKHTEHKHEIRRSFHVQLKNLWQRRLKPPLDGGIIMDTSSLRRPPTTIEELAEKYNSFVPLVTRQLNLLCSLDVLFLRSGRPGFPVTWPGDIDNRLKTLFDSMRIPQDNELGIQAHDEKPFYCLLQDDDLINRISVETDDLLQPLNGKQTIDPADARLVITVLIKPYQLTPHNMHFG